MADWRAAGRGAARTCPDADVNVAVAFGTVRLGSGVAPDARGALSSAAGRNAGANGATVTLLSPNPAWAARVVPAEIASAASCARISGPKLPAAINAKKNAGANPVKRVRRCPS